MADFSSAASVDLILLCATVAHFLLAKSLLKRVGKRDKEFAGRFEKWRIDLEQSARARQQKQRPSPAE